MSTTITTTAAPAPLVAAAPLLGGARLAIWGLFALALLLAPQIFSSRLALTMLSQMGYMVIICLSYNMLLGQGGMLSFGHAVYTGLGAFIVIHVMNMAGGAVTVPLVLVPLVGGLAGLFFAALLGYVTTKKAGTTFAMITMGIGELVASMALMFPEFFGGEGGITTDRVYGKPFFGFDFGADLQVYYLIAVYCFICTALMFAFTATPLGRMLNAVRDNPERAEFIGYNTQRVRYFSFIIAGFFAGIGGGLMTINFEIITGMDSMSLARSGAYLLFTFLGGAGFFFGPIIGAVLLVLCSVLLSELTKAWLLYLGLIFLLMVMYAPGGIASLVMANWRVVRFGQWRALLLPYLGIAASMVPVLAGAAALIEMTYHLQLNAALGSKLAFMGTQLDTGAVSTWALAIILLAAGLGVLEYMRRWGLRRWEQVQEAIEAQIRQSQAAQEPT